mgnify:FL=1
MAKQYYSMNEVPLGTDMIIKKNAKKVTLIEIHNFPTTFKTKDEEGIEKNYYTYEVDIIGWPPED